MTLPSDRLQLLFDRHLEFMVKLRTQLLDHQCFAYASEVNGLITEFHAELENDRSLDESSISRISNETAVSQETPGCPALSISETCTVVDSNTTIPELAGPNSDAPSSQQHDAMSNAHEIAAVPAHEETGNEASSIVDTVVPNDPLSANEVPKKFKQPVSQESNASDLKSNVVDPHHLVSSNGFPVKCVKHDKHIELIVTWLYEDPTVFRGGGGIREI
ncbi:uncharacterized protein Smp_202450 [Schistosoma mansoni]|uniref:uncharacterized protein n=1 Tax=Schistosoma mansoni TaxID=6183 RepID=UPI00022DC035|nr:uncharacterized protein Smp_202450 [Schistosoma mansoni]|eukprot:XP_018651617.1 uncharacterized protein Smp_202450 [Schistosoma mansoni]